MKKEKKNGHQFFMLNYLLSPKHSHSFFLLNKQPQRNRYNQDIGQSYSGNVALSVVLPIQSVHGPETYIVERALKGNVSFNFF